jgi:hypothetical protein
MSGAVCEGAATGCGFYDGLSTPATGIRGDGTYLGVERDVREGLAHRYDDRGHAGERDLGPEQPSLAAVGRREDEGDERPDVAVAVHGEDGERRPGGVEGRRARVGDREHEEECGEHRRVSLRNSSDHDVRRYAALGRDSPKSW